MDKSSKIAALQSRIASNIQAMAKLSNDKAACITRQLLQADCVLCNTKLILLSI
jgi:hypothetical protein